MIWRGHILAPVAQDEYIHALNITVRTASIGASLGVVALNGKKISMMVNLPRCSTQVSGAFPRLRFTVAHIPEWGRYRWRGAALRPVVEATLEGEDAVEAQEERQLPGRK